TLRFADGRAEIRRRLDVEDARKKLVHDVVGKQDLFEVVAQEQRVGRRRSDRLLRGWRPLSRARFWIRRLCVRAWFGIRRLLSGVRFWIRIHARAGRRATCDAEAREGDDAQE